MFDREDPIARSRIMSAVRRSNTGPEILLRRALFSIGLRFRLSTHIALPGTPDIVFPGAKVAVFVDGCFWHRCPLHGTSPRNNASFWDAKLKRNQVRDRGADAALIELEWMPIRVWEHEVKSDVGEAAMRIWLEVRLREAAPRFSKAVRSLTGRPPGRTH